MKQVKCKECGSKVSPTSQGCFMCFKCKKLVDVAIKDKKECKRHSWRVGSGIGEIINGKLKTTKLCIWCENCNKKIYARYNPKGLDGWKYKKITKPIKISFIGKTIKRRKTINKRIKG